MKRIIIPTNDLIYSENIGFENAAKSRGRIVVAYMEEPIAYFISKYTRSSKIPSKNEFHNLLRRKIHAGWKFYLFDSDAELVEWIKW